MNRGMIMKVPEPNDWSQNHYNDSVFDTKLETALIHYNIYILASVFDIAFHIMLTLNIVLIWSVQQYLCGRTIYSLKHIPALSLRNTVKTFYAWHCAWIKSFNYICNKPKFLLSVCSIFITQLGILKAIITLLLSLL